MPSRKGETMLIQATFENILSFDKPTTFSMVAGKITKQHKDHVRKIDGTPVLRGAILYGANAAGKSNLIKALSLFCTMFLSNDCTLLRGKAFQLGAKPNPDSIFDILFRWLNQTFRYHVKTDGETIKEESLCTFANGVETVLFGRSGNDIRPGEPLDSDWYRWRTVQGKSLYLSKLISDGLEENANAIPNSDLVLAAVAGLRAIQPFVLTGLRPGNVPMLAPGAPEAFKDFLKQLLIGADAGIADVVATPLTSKELSDIPLADLLPPIGADLVRATGLPHSFAFFWGDRYLLVRQTPNGYRGESIRLLHGTKPFPLSAESDGTIRLLEFAPFLLFLTMFPATYLVDEFDRNLHPVLAKHLLELVFKTANPDAQFIVTAHDTTLMTHDLWRTDEIWFAEKRQDGSTDLYSMYNFTPRFDKNLEKGYRQGLYGAVPFPGGGLHQ